MTNIGKYCLFFVAVIIFCSLIIKPINAKDTALISHEELGWTNIKVLDINKAFIIALMNNPTMAVFNARVKQAKQKCLEAKAHYWPAIFFNGALSSQDSLNMNSEDQIKLYELELNTSWIFFDGFESKFKNIIADYGEQISLFRLDNARRILLSSVSVSFYTAQLLREKVNIAMADEIFNKRKLNEAEARYRMGSGSLSEVLNFRIRLNDARSILDIEEGNYKIEMFRLSSLLGITDYEFISDLTLSSLLPETDQELIPPLLDNMVDVYIKSRPDFNILKLSVEQAKANICVKKAIKYPKFFISAAVNAKKIGNMRFCEDDILSSIRLGLSYDLFAGGLHMAHIKEAKEREIEIENEMRNFLISTEAEIKSAVFRVRNAQIKVVSQRKNTELLELTRDLVEKEYNAEYASLVRLNEVQNDLIKSRSQLVGAISELRQSWIELKLLTGEKIY